MQLRTPHDVITYLLDNSPHRSMARAMTEGKVEFLGGFSQVSRHVVNAGWVVRVTSVYGRVWIMGVMPEEASHSFWVKRLEEIPWEFKLKETGNPLFDGASNDTS